MLDRYTEPDYDNIRQLIETGNRELAKQLLIGAQVQCKLLLLELLELMGCSKMNEEYNGVQGFYTYHGIWQLRVKKYKGIVELKLRGRNTGVHKGAIIFENMNEPNTIRGLFNRRQLIEIIM